MTETPIVMSERFAQKKYFIMEYPYSCKKVLYELFRFCMTTGSFTSRLGIGTGFGDFSGAFHEILKSFKVLKSFGNLLFIAERKALFIVKGNDKHLSAHLFLPLPPKNTIESNAEPAGKRSYYIFCIGRFFIHNKQPSFQRRSPHR